MPASTSDVAANPTQFAAALLTPRGRGAVATVAFRGDAAALDAAGLFRGANRKPLEEQPIDRIAFGRWGEDPAEDVVLCRVADDRIEIHCHGGDAAANRILTHLQSVGVTIVDWREFIGQTAGRFDADVFEALAKAATPRTASIIAHQATGPLRHAFERLTTIDPAPDRTERLSTLNEMERRSRFGLHLTEPWNVVLYGEPNVGKSSLINALVGFERAIVFDQPGTTRDVVTAETAIDGWPIRLSDTAGLRSAGDEIETVGVERAKAAIQAADLRIWVVDRSRPYDQATAMEAIALKPGIIVLNKSDLPDAWHETAPLPAGTVAVSAKTGDGIRDLLRRIVQQLVAGIDVANLKEATPLTRRQIDAVKAAGDAIRRDDDAGFRRAIARVFP